MCHRSFYEHEQHLGADAGRSLFRMLRDLFRRPARPPEQTPAVTVAADVIPLRSEGARRSVDAPTKRADAA